MKVICVMNRKGGVGKTTTTQMIIYYLRSIGKKVLAIDMDSQSNLSIFSRTYDMKNDDVYKMLQNQPFHIRDDMIPANFDLGNFEIKYKNQGDKLRNCITSITKLYKHYDYIIIDTSPYLSSLSLNSLVASDYVVIPTQAEAGAYEGVRQTLELVESTNKKFKLNIKVAGILLTFFDKRVIMYQKYQAKYRELAEQYKTVLFDATVSKGVVIPEAQARGKNILEYGIKTRPVKAYIEFGEQLLKVMGDK